MGVIKTANIYYESLTVDDKPFVTNESQRTNHPSNKVRSGRVVARKVSGILAYQLGHSQVDLEIEKVRFMPSDMSALLNRLRDMSIPGRASCARPHPNRSTVPSSEVQRWAPG